MNVEILSKLGIKVNLASDYPVVCETLERIGIISHKDKKVFPSCYCVKYEDENGQLVYTICHFKEMFVLQDKISTFSDVDRARLRTIVYLLQSWGLLKAVNSDDIKEILVEKMSVLPYKDKKQYKIIHKFKNNP